VLANNKRMKEIDDIIELNTNDKLKRLSFATKYLVQSNFTFDLTVFSNGFGGTNHFCVKRDQLEKLCADLNEMHSLLSGRTAIEDNDSDAFVEFNIEPNGHLIVRGQVGGSHQDHSVIFKFMTDQTCIPNFTRGFNMLLRNQDDN
jgi:hypothetical protein